MMNTSAWKKSTRSYDTSNCVEMACRGTCLAIRDSKHPGPELLLTERPALLAALKNGQLDRADH